jgi:sodium-dependent dicarboxylate transporter 2/3/5
MILSVTAILWLTEPLHKIPAAVIALAAAASLFITRILKKKHLSEIDWSTLLLIAGGITIGRLLEQSGVIAGLANSFAFEMVSPTIALFLLCFLTAALSAVMSNTATVVLMLPIAVAIIPGPSTAILVALSASFGIPLLISTPPNAMAFGQGGLRFGDLFWPGIVVMVVGCALVSLTGKQVLNLAGIP